MLYSEDDVRGLKFVKENTENQESELDIEMLFNAVLSNKAKFKELFS
jgi:ABC-2 type transport system ATP-binding protein